jgi:hypothetical protein
MTIACKVGKILLIVVATGIILASLLAPQLGLDPDGRWGGFRSELLFLGIAPLFVLAVSWFVTLLDRKLLSRSEDIDSPQMSVEPTQEKQKPRSTRPRKFLEGNRLRWILLPAFILLIELLYVWMVSVGHMTDWPRISSYYDLLADAFSHGKISLLVKPPPILEQLAYPWPTANREGIRVLGDLSYFRGKYFLYWGPAPAILLAPWKLIIDGPIGDEFIVFVAISVTALFAILSLLYIKDTMFPSLPGWLLACSVLTVATVHPMLWVLNRPAIYEAAIASGQAFLLGGIYFALPIWDGSSRKRWRWLLTGILWSGAIASRIVLVLPVAVLVMATLWFFWSRREDRGSIRVLFRDPLWMIIVITLCIALLSLYNYVRFGNIFETGVRYQLSKNDLNQIIQDGLLINPAFLPANLFHYVFTPLRIRNIFPFLRAYYGSVPGFASLISLVNTPENYIIETITGIFFTTPILLLYFPLIWHLACRRVEYSSSLPTKMALDLDSPISRHAHRLASVFLLAGIAATPPTLLLFWVAIRYLLDSIPSLVLGSVLGSWILYGKNRNSPIRNVLTITSIILFAITGALISFALAFAGADSRFDDFNPELYKLLVAMFSLK